jgi:hypothetical protein
MSRAACNLTVEASALDPVDKRMVLGVGEESQKVCRFQMLGLCVAIRSFSVHVLQVLYS